MGKMKERLIMKKQDGKTPLEWIVTIAIVLILAGVAVAMIFGNTDVSSKIKEKLQNTNTNNTVQTNEI